MGGEALQDILAAKPLDAAGRIVKRTHEPLDARVVGVARADEVADLKDAFAVGLEAAGQVGLDAKEPHGPHDAFGGLVGVERGIGGPEEVEARHGDAALLSLAALPFRRHDSIGADKGVETGGSTRAEKAHLGCFTARRKRHRVASVHGFTQP